MKKILIVLVFLSFGSMYAGGYRVALQGQRMLGMAHAGISVFNSTESAFFNPAGLSFLDSKFSVTFGVSGITSTVKFQNSLYNQTAQTDNKLGTPFYLYMAYKVDDKVTLGLAVYTPFGSSLKWEDGWAGSHIVNDIAMKVFYIQPSLAYKFSETFSVSGSLIMAYGNVSYNKDINRYLTDENGNKTNAQIDSGTTGAAGYAFSAAFKPSKDVAMGISYRSSIILDAKYGTGTFNNVPVFLQNKLKTTGLSAQLPMPAELGVGVSFKPFKKMLVAVDYNYTYWDIYQELVIDFKNDLPSSVSDKSYKNTNTYRFGAEYTVNDKIKVRAGYYYDQSPLTSEHFSPETPSLDSNNYTFGIGYEMKKMTIDFSFLYVDGIERTDYTYVKGEGPSAHRFGGTYISNAIIPGLGITYSIDK
jgi:long-chain fatty acid transport protein